MVCVTWADNNLIFSVSDINKHAKFKLTMQHPVCQNTLYGYALQITKQRQTRVKKGINTNISHLIT